MDPSLTSLENLPPDVMKRVCKELAELVKTPLEDISVTVNERDIKIINATITGPAQTPYQAGVFSVRLKLPKDFPQSPPKGVFLTKIFHPNVAVPSGEICVNTLKKDWNPTLGIKHVLLTIKCLLIAPNPESALNEEAGKLLLEDYAAYASRAEMMTSVHARAKSSLQVSCIRLLPRTQSLHLMKKPGNCYSKTMQRMQAGLK